MLWCLVKGTSGPWCSISVSEKLSASLFMMGLTTSIFRLVHWTWRQKTPPKRWYLCTTLHDVIFRKTKSLIGPTVETSSLPIRLECISSIHDWPLSSANIDRLMHLQVLGHPEPLVAGQHRSRRSGKCSQPPGSYYCHCRLLHHIRGSHWHCQNRWNAAIHSRSVGQHPQATTLSEKIQAVTDGRRACEAIRTFSPLAIYHEFI